MSAGMSLFNLQPPANLRRNGISRDCQRETRRSGTLHMPARAPPGDPGRHTAYR